MTDVPGFDPYDLLGVAVDADAIVIQFAYKARIRAVHPDVAGAAGLEQAKRLNVARDWLLDPYRRAQLPRSRAAQRQPAASTGRTGQAPTRGAQAHRRQQHHPAFDGFARGANAPDFGPRRDALHAFMRAISALSRDERARVNYSLGENRPVFFEGYSDYFGPELQARSRALRDAVSLTWNAGVDEQAPFVSTLGLVLPSGFLVANAYAQWMLLGDFFRQELGDAVFRSRHFVDSFAVRCTGPWEGSVRQARYGPNDQGVRAFFRTADTLSADSAERLARSWRDHMGRDGLGAASDHIGPGVWLPDPPNYPQALRISGQLAVVDASRIEPPTGLDGQHHDAYRYGLRLTAHVVALGLVNGSDHDYLRPWRDAMEDDRTAWSRLRSWMQPG
ncbi:MAG: J domain-containing protein [Chloroflexota bacterium]